ncbi:MAG: AAA family ATPase [Vicinamibacteria bacterium]|jgi:hypothetical protein|nr:AAA family ATPase [Vicinamibacteria bacterium]
MLQRSIDAAARRILFEYGKMAFVSGPRQVGKTTFARGLLKSVGQGRYFNWDVMTDQRRLAKDPYFFEQDDRSPKRPFLVVLDEIHKYPRWKRYLKGAFDRCHEDFGFLITGSGRLDLFKRGGDSLLGRYFSLPLFPLSVGEIVGSDGTYRAFLAALDDPLAAHKPSAAALDQLLRCSGFPEPFTRASEAFLNPWSAERKKLLVREDIRDTTAIRQLAMIEMLANILPERVGSLLSINSLREDLNVAFETAREWLLVLSHLYYTFQVLPYSRSLDRAIRKSTKVYLFDWTEIDDAAVRLENLIALHLLKAVSLWAATGEGKTTLNFVRDREGREADFLILENNRPLCLIECKYKDVNASPNLIHFQQRLKAPHAIQLIAQPGICRKIRTDSGALWILSADRLLRALP